MFCIYLKFFLKIPMDTLPPEQPLLNSEPSNPQNIPMQHNHPFEPGK